MRRMKPFVLALGTAAAMGGTTVVAAEQSITVASFGGSYQEAQRKALFNPAEKELGITINEQTLTGLADVRVQVRSGAVTWDVVDLGATDCARGQREGLFEPLDFSEINTDGIADRMVGESWIGIIYYSTVISWNTQTVDNPPQNWAEFWNAKQFPGSRSIRNYPHVQLEMALLADGVEPDNLYPLDVDRAFSKLEEIKPHITTWWTSGAQGVQLVRDGEVDLIAAWDGRLREAMEDGAKIDYHFNQGLLNADCLAVPKGAPNKELAMKAIAKFVSPEYQARIPKHITYGPINSKAFDTQDLSKKTASAVNTAPANRDKQVVIDPTWWGKHAAEVQERWDSFVQR